MSRMRIAGSRVRRICLAGACVPAILALSGTQSVRRQHYETYSRVIDSYCSGGFEAVAPDVLQWTPDAIDHVHDVAMELPAGKRLAAAAMHAEAFATQWADERNHTVLNHRELSRALAQSVRKFGPDQSPLVRSWALAWGYLYLSHVFLEAAAAQFAEGESWFPDDAAFVTGSGIVNELTSYPLGQQTIRAPDGANPADVQIQSARAIALYRAALKLDSTDIEAHVRLGRLLMLSGDRERAAAELEQAQAPATEARWLYLSHLFLGSMFEDEGRYREAEQHYEVALRAVPDAQTAMLARAALRARLGQPVSAETAARFGWTRPFDPYDPWSEYLFSRPYRFCAAIEALRKAACR
jgi:tetratricopeptide (TPR) repeat protein